MTDIPPTTDTSAVDPLASIAQPETATAPQEVEQPTTGTSGEGVPLVAAAEVLAGGKVVNDVATLQGDVQNIAASGQVDVPEVQAHVEQFIADGRARVDLVLEPLKRIDHPSAGVIAGAISDAFHAMIRHFALPQS